MLLAASFWGSREEDSGNGKSDRPRDSSSGASNVYFNYKGVWTGGSDVVGFTP